MSGANDPPDPGLTQTVFNTLNAATFNSTTGAWTDANGAVLYLLLTRNNASGSAGWIAGKLASYPANPYGPATAFAGTVIASGSWNQNGTVTYNGVAYVFSLRRNSSNVQVVEAVTP